MKRFLSNAAKGIVAGLILGAAGFTPLQAVAVIVALILFKE